jgi:3-isopropylmalate dehydrogenase
MVGAQYSTGKYKINRNRDAGIKVRPEEAILGLRLELNSFANLRPCKFASSSLGNIGPIKPEITKGTDFVIVRENCGGAYFGTKVEEDDYASDPWQYSRAEIEQVARLAGDMAMEYDPPQQVISCDKANVLASSRLWRRVVTELYEKEYPKVKLSHQLADSAAMLMVKNPRMFNGIILTDNTYIESLFKSRMSETNFWMAVLAIFCQISRP